MVNTIFLSTAISPNNQTGYLQSESRGQNGTGRNIRNFTRRILSFLSPSFLTSSLEKSTPRFPLRDYLSKSPGKRARPYPMFSSAKPSMPPDALQETLTCHACEAGLQGKCMTENVIGEIRCVLYQDSNYTGETKPLITLCFN